MCAYTKTTWNSGGAPGIDADKLNNLETQHEKAMVDVMPASGNYVGNNTQNRAIAHGLGRTPKFVHLVSNTDAYTPCVQVTGVAGFVLWNNSVTVVTAFDGTNIYVGGAAAGYNTNKTGVNYYWVAF
jgi:hypothetical protein